MRQLLAIAAVLVIAVILLISSAVRKARSKSLGDFITPTFAVAQRIQASLAYAQKVNDAQSILKEAATMAANYDYDSAIELLKTNTKEEIAEDVSKAITDYTSAKENLVQVKPEDVTHIFYHSLVVDPQKAFSGTDAATAGFKQWMTTVDEFNKITQTMYDRGYVLISMYDIVEKVTASDGTTRMQTKELYLPADKKPYILSLDDLSYYHSYDGRGVASRLVLDKDGTPTCEYIQDDGTVVTGSYDCVPLLDDFMEAHPDGCYKGARGTVALTGYDGILGYRTDIAYKTRENLDPDQIEYLEKHPDFDYDKEVEGAQQVAEAMKAEGWTFASHTWGHLNIGSTEMEKLKRDTENWDNYVKPLVGDTNMIIFAHGTDLDPNGSKGYDSNEKYQYLKSMGFDIFCTVSSYQYTLEVHDDFVHDGRRNLDGYRLWNDVHNDEDWTSDLFDASEILDPARTDMPAL